MRRAAARLLAKAPDPALEGDLRLALVREKDPGVVEPLVAALARLPVCVNALRPAIEESRDARLAAAFARLMRAVAIDAIAAKMRDGSVPGFYDGQFADLWPLTPDLPEELLRVAYDDAHHLVVRVLAVMALAETKRPTLERDFAGLLKPESDERERMDWRFRVRGQNVIDVLLDREFALSKYVRFALAKAGQTAAIRRMIRELDDYLADPHQRRDIALRGDDDRGAAYWRAEFLRELAFDVGYYYQQFDDYASAERRYRDLLVRFPESRVCENCHYNLACICSIQGRRREALDHLRDAIRCGFTNDAWLLEDGDLAPLRDDPEFRSLVELARTGSVDDTGRDWIRRLQHFLPAGTRSLFELPPDLQREVLARAASDLSEAQRRRVIQDAPVEQRPRLERVLREATGGAH